MPKVPLYDELRIASSAPEKSKYFTHPDIPDTAGKQAHATIGADLLNLGGSAAKIALDMAETQTQAAAKDVDASFTAGLNDLMRNPETGYMVQQGKNAVDGYKATAEAIDAQLRRSLDSLTPQARETVSPVLTARAQSATNQAMTHAGQQTQHWRMQSSQSRAEISIQDAAANYRDAAHFKRSLGTALNEVDEQGALAGLDAATQEVQRRKYVDAAFRARYEAWRQDNAAEALADFQVNARSVSPLLRDQIERELFTAAEPQLAALVNQAGGVEAVAQASASGKAEPRGIRNNNPGNIMRGSSAWQGETPSEDSRYATFSTPEAGIRAMGKLLLTYQGKYGLNTLDGIVSRWAPATENDPGRYAAAIAKAIGTTPGAKIDIHDPATLTRVVGAMIQFENGKQPYTPEQVKAGVDSALNGTRLPAATATTALPDWRDPGVTTGHAVIDALPPDQRMRVLHMAQSQVSQGNAKAREDLHARTRDAAAEYMARGAASNPPSEAEFIRAYGQGDGVRRYRELQDVAATGVEMQRVKGLPTAALNAMLDRDKPRPGDGFADRQRHYQALQAAVDHAKSERQADPIGYVLQNQTYGLKPLPSPMDTKGFSAELSRRSGAMARVAQDYGTPPRLMSNPEASAFAEHLGKLQTTDKANTLAMVYRAAGPAGVQSISAQIKDKDQRLAVAAMLTTHSTNMGNSAALLYLQGRDAIAEKRAKIDEAKETGVMAEINNAIEGVYQTPQGRAAAAEAAFGIYAKFRADGGGDVAQAVNIATGGLMDFNGGRIAKPYGWSDARFKDTLTGTVANTLRKQGGEYLAGKNRVNAADLAKMLPGARLQTYGAGSYLVRVGGDVVRSANGVPFILQVGP